MHFEGTHKFPMGTRLVWALLNDPGVLARATPGIKELVAYEPDRYDAHFHIKLGPINSVFKGKLDVVDKITLRRYKLVVNVDAPIGVVQAAVIIALQREDDGTVVSFTGDGQLSGKLARMGQRVLTGVARMFTKQFFKAIGKETPGEEILAALGSFSGGERMAVPIKVTVNGKVHEHEVEPRQLLVQYLRETLGLTGTHVGCDTSNCGSCTIHVDGKSVKACTLLAVQADGATVRTVEGLADGDTLHPIQEGFNQEHGLQCGFCTPGMIMTSLELLENNADPGDAEIRHALEGNFCRCTGYENIVRSVKYAAAKMK